MIAVWADQSIGFVWLALGVWAITAAVVWTLQELGRLPTDPDAEFARAHAAPLTPPRRHPIPGGSGARTMTFPEPFITSPRVAEVIARRHLRFILQRVASDAGLAPGTVPFRGVNPLDPSPRSQYRLGR